MGNTYLAQMGHLLIYFLFFLLYSNQWNDELDDQNIENVSDVEDTRYILREIKELVKRMKDTEEKVIRKLFLCFIYLLYFREELCQLYGVSNLEIIRERYNFPKITINKIIILFISERGPLASLRRQGFYSRN